MFAMLISAKSKYGDTVIKKAIYVLIVAKEI